MGLKPFKKSIDRPFPRSVLSSLHEPMLDPKDGHGARSERDVMILQMWKAARKGDDDILCALVELIVRESLTELKDARSTRRYIMLPGGNLRMRSLVPVMVMLGLISAEEVTVPPERDGYAEVTSLRKIMFADWFEDYAFNRPGVDPKVVEGVRGWIARGALQRPFRGDPD